MKPPPRPADEARRLAALREYHWLDTSPEPAFDELTALVAKLCETPIAMISLVDEHRQWFKSKVGLSVGETPRDVSFCGHAILQTGLFIVPDAAKDERFAGNPLVTSSLHVRFYAAAPLATATGQVLGTLAVMDRVPRQLTLTQQEILRVLSRQVMAQLELRRQTHEQAASEARLRVREEQLRLYAQHSPAAVAMFDRDMKYLVASKQWMENNHLTDQSFIGRCHYEVVPDIPQRWKDVHQRCLAGAIEQCDAEPFLRANGQTDWIRWEVRPWHLADGSIGGIILFYEDITEKRRVEAEAQLLAKRLTLATDAAAIGIWDWDVKADQWYATDTYCTMLGYAPETEAADRQVWLQRVHPDDQAAVGEKIQAVLAGSAAPYEYEARMQHADGSYRWIQVVGRVLATDEQGKPIRMMGVRMDITKRKQAERHVQRLNRVYSMLSDVNQIIVREKDPQAMLAAVCQIAVAKGQFQMAWIGRLKSETQTLQPVAASGVVAGYLDRFNFDLQDTTQADGPTLRCFRSGEHAICNDIAHDPRYLPWRDEALRRGYQSSGGFPLKVEALVVGVFNLYAAEPGFFDTEELRLLDELAMDISFALEVSQREQKRLQTEAELRWRTAFFEAQAESTLDGILVVDSQGRKVLQNTRMKELWKLPPLIADDADSTRQRKFTASQTKNPQQFNEKIDYLYAHPDEVSRDEIELIDGTIMDRSSAPVRDKAGNYYGRIWTFRDITQQRQLEAQFRQSQKMEAIGQLAGGVAHDFNNILAAIMMQVELAASEPNLSSGVQATLNEIKADAERAANLTRQLLAFSRRQVMQTRTLDLNETVISLTKMLQRILGEDVRLQLNLHPHSLLTRADAGMLDQVLLNLVVNARDAMPDGGRLTIDTAEKIFKEAEVAAQPDIIPGRYVCLRVADTGCGMKAEVMARICEPFFTTKEPGKGTGLGLATVFGIIKQHGGSLAVESQVGRGTTFSVYLRADASAALDSDEAPARHKPRGGTETILLVEDEPSVRRLTSQILQRAGYQVLVAANGVEALELWEQHQDKIQLLFTDVVMPEGISGRDLAAQLQARHPRLQVIFTSGYSADFAGRDLALQAGQHFIQKPSAPAQVLEIVRQCLDGQQPGL